MLQIGKIIEKTAIHLDNFPLLFFYGRLVNRPRWVDKGCWLDQNSKLHQLCTEARVRSGWKPSCSSLLTTPISDSSSANCSGLRMTVWFNTCSTRNYSTPRSRSCAQRCCRTRDMQSAMRSFPRKACSASGCLTWVSVSLLPPA